MFAFSAAGIQDDFQPPVRPRARSGRVPALPLADLQDSGSLPHSLLDAPGLGGGGRRGGFLAPPDFSPRSSPDEADEGQEGSHEASEESEEEDEALTNYRDNYARRRRSRAVLYHLSGSYQNQKRSGKLQLNTKVSAYTVCEICHEIVVAKW